MKFLTSLILITSSITTIYGQRTTALDANGNTVIASIDPAGGISIIQTIGTPSTPVTSTLPSSSSSRTTSAAVVASTTAVARTTSAPVVAATTTRAAPVAPVTTAPPRAGGNQAVNADRTNYATCTTQGCAIPPTIYTDGTSLYTFVATTPRTPIPTFAMTGKLLNLSAYITTTFTTTLPMMTIGGSGSSGAIRGAGVAVGGVWGGVMIAMVGAVGGVWMVL